MNRWLSAIALGLIVLAWPAHSDEPAKTADLEQLFREELAKGQRAIEELTRKLEEGRTRLKEDLARTERIIKEITSKLESKEELAKQELNRLKEELAKAERKPTYVGLLRLLEVRKNEAVGRIINRAAMLQVGDEVADDILGKR